MIHTSPLVLQSLDANEQFPQCLLSCQEVGVYGHETSHPFFTNGYILLIQLSLALVFSLKKGRGHQVLRGHKARLSGSEKSFLPFFFQFPDPWINDLVHESVVKSADLDAILAVEEGQLLAVDHSTDFLEGKSINIEGRWPKVV